MDIVAKFKFDTKEAQKNIDEVVKGLGDIKEITEDVEDATKKLESVEEKAAKERADRLTEELADLKELKARRDQAYSVEDIQEYNKRIAETEKRVQALSEGFNDASKNTEEMKKVGQEAFGLLDRMTFGLAGKMRGLITTIRGVTTGMKALKVAIISTGIGAIVVALGSLVAYFTQTKKGAELLSKGLAGLKAVFNVIVQQVSAFGEFLVAAFENPQQALKDFGQLIVDNVVNRFKGLIDLGGALGDILEGLFTGDWDQLAKGLEDAATATVQMTTGMDKVQQSKITDYFKGLGDQIADTATAAIDLEARMQRLVDAERLLRIEHAKSRAELKAQNIIAEDVTKSYEERIKAAQNAAGIERKLLAEELAAATERLAIIKAQNEALGDTAMAEDLDRQADAEVRLNEIREASLELQTTIQNKLNALRTEQAAKAEAARLAREKKQLDDFRFFIRQQQIDEEVLTDRTIEELDERLEAYNKSIDKRQEKSAEAYAKDLVLQRELAKKAKEDAEEQAALELQYKQASQDQAIAFAAELASIQLNESNNRIAQIQTELQKATGARKKQLEDELAIEKKRNKQYQLTQLTINTINQAVALGRAFSDLGPIGGAIAAAALIAQFAYQAALIKSQKFEDGTDFVKPTDSRTGKKTDDIPALLTKGEAVIDVDMNRKHHDLIKAIRRDKVEDFLHVNYSKTMQNSIVGSAPTYAFNTNFDDINIVNGLRQNRYSLDRNFDRLIKAHERTKVNLRRVA